MLVHFHWRLHKHLFLLSVSWPYVADIYRLKANIPCRRVFGESKVSVKRVCKERICYYCIVIKALVQNSIKNKDKIIEGLKQRDPDMDTSFITEEQIVDLLYRKPDDIRNSINETVNLYNSFCDNVLAYLLEHDYSEIIENEEA